MHNTRIERIWVNVTHGFGGKWSEFFYELESNHGLNVDNVEHLWLLQHVFLHQINMDAMRWAKVWNSHKIQLRGERNKSPEDMFLFSMLQDGPRGFSRQRGIHNDDLPPDELASFGVDWEVIDDWPTMEHHRENNPDEDHDDPEQIDDNLDPFLSTVPLRLSEVLCEAPNCPFTADQIDMFDAELQREVDVDSKSMLVRTQVWKQALRIAMEVYDGVI